MPTPRTSGLAVLLVAALSATSGTGFADWSASNSWRIGDFRIDIAERPFAARVHHGPTGRVVLDGRGQIPFVRIGHSEPRVRTVAGLFHFSGKSKVLGTGWSVERADSSASRLELRVSLQPARARSNPGDLIVIFLAAQEGTLSMDLSTNTTEANRLMLAFASPPDERFLGLGAQYNHATHEGRTVPAWVSEQGIGRTDAMLRLPFSGRTTDSYFPVPWLLSTRGYGLLVESSARSVFGLRAPAARDRVTIEIWEQRARLCLITGSAPAAILERLTRKTGRPRLLPDWAFGVWLALQGGRQRVEALLEQVRAAGVPIDAVWSQDWLGARRTPVSYELPYHWTADEVLYPDMAGFIARLHASGIRFLGYFNPFVEPDYPEFGEARDRGCLVTDRRSRPLLERVVKKKAAMLDLSNPEAGRLVGEYMRGAMRLGMDGWMADFGEWLPWEARISAPQGAPLFHNRYPVEWARVNREAGMAERPSGDFVIFSRSGFTGSGQWVDLVWAGDQNTDFGLDDGLPTVFPAGLHLGLSGVGLFHFDAGGFTSLRRSRGPEVLMRGVEAAAMSPLLRTHEGYFKPLNTQVYSDAKVLAHFAEMARLHKRLQPDIVAAAREASVSGMPVMRHLYLMYPEDPSTLEMVDQYMLGDRWLAAPVIRRGQREREVYFPRGRWRHWKSGQTYEGPAWQPIEAPLGLPPLFEKLDAPAP